MLESRSWHVHAENRDTVIKHFSLFFVDKGFLFFLYVDQALFSSVEINWIGSENYSRITILKIVPAFPESWLTLLSFRLTTLLQEKDIHARSTAALNSQHTQVHGSLTIIPRPQSAIAAAVVQPSGVSPPALTALASAPPFRTARLSRGCVGRAGLGQRRAAAAAATATAAAARTPMPEAATEVWERVGTWSSSE